MDSPIQYSSNFTNYYILGNTLFVDESTLYFVCIPDKKLANVRIVFWGILCGLYYKKIYDRKFTIVNYASVWSATYDCKL